MTNNRILRVAHAAAAARFDGASMLAGTTAPPFGVGIAGGAARRGPLVVGALDLRAALMPNTTRNGCLDAIAASSASVAPRS